MKLECVNPSPATQSHGLFRAAGGGGGLGRLGRGRRPGRPGRHGPLGAPLAGRPVGPAGRAGRPGLAGSGRPAGRPDRMTRMATSRRCGSIGPAAPPPRRSGRRPWPRDGRLPLPGRNRAAGTWQFGPGGRAQPGVAGSGRRDSERHTAGSLPGLRRQADAVPLTPAFKFEQFVSEFFIRAMLAVHGGAARATLLRQGQRDSHRRSGAVTD